MILVYLKGSFNLGYLFHLTWNIFRLKQQKAQILKAL